LQAKLLVVNGIGYCGDYISLIVTTFISKPDFVRNECTARKQTLIL